MYIPKSIAKKFVEKFHKNLTQGHNGTTALIRKLEKEYIIHRIYALAQQVIKKNVQIIKKTNSQSTNYIKDFNQLRH